MAAPITPNALHLPQTKCLLIVALPAEANPLITRYKLSALTTIPFRCWKANDIALVETGIGKLNAAAATGYALALTGASCCVNIGIAGSENELGSVFVAHRVVDEGSGKVWYPQQIWNQSMESLTVTTLDAPSSQYTEDSAFDMEMSGVMSAATRFLSTEMVQSLKIISDNSESDLNKISKGLVIDLISAQVPTIENAIDNLIKLTDQVVDSGLAESLMHKILEGKYPLSDHSFHVTESQRVELKRLLQRHIAFNGVLPDELVFSQSKTTRQLIHTLKSIVDKLKTTY